MGRTVQYLSILMVILYISIGVAVVDGYNTLFHIPEKYSLPMGIVLIGYGIFRAYKVYQKYYRD